MGRSLIKQYVQAAFFSAMLSAWTVAYASQTLLDEPGFLDQVRIYKMEVWAFIALFSTIGFLLRLSLENEEGEGKPFKLEQTAAKLCMSFVAGLLAFGLIEWGWRQIPIGWRPPFGAIGVLIVLASAYSRRTIEFVTTSIFARLKKWINRGATSDE